MSAIVWREYTLLCNGADNFCAEQYGPFGVDRSRAALRKLAAKDGWTHVHEPGRLPRFDQDFCPAHKPQPAATEVTELTEGKAQHGQA